MSGYPTGIGASDADSISLLGHDLAGELLGQVSFGELSYWLATRRRPNPGQLRLFETVLVALADHGFTPTAIAARLTYYSAPDSLQGAIAAGLLGGGSRFLGVTEDTGQYLHAVVERVESSDGFAASGGWDAWDDAAWDELARTELTARRAAGLKVPGIGHPVHKQGDPRTPVVFRVAREAGVEGPHLRLFAAIGRVVPDVLGRTLPLNGAGVAGAALADAGLPVELLRGFALLARTAGLIGHLAEEMTEPIGPSVYYEVDRNADYRPPAR